MGLGLRLTGIPPAASVESAAEGRATEGDLAAEVGEERVGREAEVGPTTCSEEGGRGVEEFWS